MIRILVTDVGRSPALNFCRSLRLSNEDIFILGIDTNKYSLTWAEADVVYLSPSYKNDKYIDYLNYLIDKHNINLVYPSKTGPELLFLANNQHRINAKIFLPNINDINLFEDKWKTYEFIKNTSLCKVPTTYLICEKKDLYFRMKELSNNFTKEVWLRQIYGSGGAGSIATNNYVLAKSWIERSDGWGNFTISEKLTEKSFTWSGLWKNGELIVSQSRERLYWEFANRSPSGVTGITGAQKIYYSPELHQLSINIIKTISDCPNGCISIDYTLDNNGGYNLTEIQASRLYTSTLFMTKLGVNLPFLFCKIALDMPISPKETQSITNNDDIWLKYVETLPQLVNNNSINQEEEFLNNILSIL